MSRRSSPIRTPDAVRKVLSDAATRNSCTVTEYVSMLATKAEDKRAVGRLSNGKQSFVTARPRDVAVVRQLAHEYDRRQWEVLLELHLLWGDD